MSTIKTRDRAEINRCVRAMITPLFPVALLCACSTMEPTVTAEKPELEQVVTPYAQALREAGITRVIADRGSALIRLDTGSGPVYFTYPANQPRPEFALEVDSGTVRASAQSFESDRDSPAVAAILKDAITNARNNNVVQWIRANPWH
jgi:hypothetical protein